MELNQHSWKKGINALFLFHLLIFFFVGISIRSNELIE